MGSCCCGKESCKNGDVVIAADGDAVYEYLVDTLEPLNISLFDNELDAFAIAVGGIKLELKWSMPIEAALRFFTNKAVAYTANTDIGEFLKECSSSETMKILAGLERTVKGKVLTAARLLESAQEMIPKIHEERRNNPGSINDRSLFKFYTDTLQDCIVQAQMGFDSCDDQLLKIKAIQILCCAYISREVVLENLPEVIAKDLIIQLKLLMDMPLVKNYLKIYVGEKTADLTDIKERREARLREVLQILVHVQGWFAVNEVPLSFLKEIKSYRLVKAAVQKGLFDKGEDRLELTKREEKMIRIMKNETVLVKEEEEKRCCEEDERRSSRSWKIQRQKKIDGGTTEEDAHTKELRDKKKEQAVSSPDLIAQGLDKIWKELTVTRNGKVEVNEILFKKELAWLKAKKSNRPSGSSGRDS